MEHYTEFTGKTSEEAIEEGLKELGLKREEADIRILEEGKKKYAFEILELAKEISNER